MKRKQPRLLPFLSVHGIARSRDYEKSLIFPPKRGALSTWKNDYQIVTNV